MKHKCVCLNPKLTRVENMYAVCIRETSTPSLSSFTHLLVVLLAFGFLQGPRPAVFVLEKL